MRYSRRSALQLALALWAKAEDQAHQHPAAEPPSAGYSFKFFTPIEVSTVQRYAEILIPASDRSGGAAAAKIERFIDHVLSLAAPSLQRSWRAGLRDWAKAKDAGQWLARAAKNEFSPRTREDQFFILFKTASTAAFYTSQEGILKELGYQGMGFLRDFPGYQGEAFEKPADYQPLLRSRT